MIINLNWTKNISFGSSIWAGSSTKLMLTTEIPAKSTHHNQVFVIQRFLISFTKRGDGKEKQTLLYMLYNIIFWKNLWCKCFSMSTLLITLFRTMLSSLPPWMKKPWRSYQDLHLPCVICHNSIKKQ